MVVCVVMHFNTTTVAVTGLSNRYRIAVAVVCSCNPVPVACWCNQVAVVSGSNQVVVVFCCGFQSITK